MLAHMKRPGDLKQFWLGCPDPWGPVFRVGCVQKPQIAVGRWYKHQEDAVEDTIQTAVRCSFAHAHAHKFKNQSIKIKDSEGGPGL